MKEDDVMISTFDNPWNPFTNFDEWFAFDHEKGYCSLERVARLYKADATMSEIEQDRAYSAAIDRLIELDILNIFTKVPRPL